jgi:exodeoxyribonuclease VII large subunit
MLEFPEDPMPAPRPWTVSRLNREVRDCLEGRIGSVWVEGEISNLRRQPSGHQYFSLKDEACQVSCVMFRGSSLGAQVLRDGLQIELFGELGVYEPRGQYQIVVRRVQPRGAGELEARLRALQEKLRAEGLFENASKKPLPAHPVRVGVVTSPAGAAIRDFLHVLARRAPHIEVIIAPVRVQGRGAAAEIAAAIAQFADPAGSGFPIVDVIVVTRGGGSLEDLWEFNEETVARAISSSRIPVISAVGHEIDVTTSDLVADVRAPTPSAAAEILSSDRAETLDRLSQFFRRLHRDTLNRLNLSGSHLARLTASGVFLWPVRRIAEGRQSTDELGERGHLAMQNHLAILRETSLRTRTILQARSPARQLQTWQEHLSSLVQRQQKDVAARLRQLQQQQRRHAHALELLGPKQTLARGFTITMDQNRRPLLSAPAAAREKEIITLFVDGEITSRPA